MDYYCALVVHIPKYYNVSLQLLGPWNYWPSALLFPLESLETIYCSYNGLLAQSSPCYQYI